MIMANPKNWLKSRFNRSPERGFGNIEKEYLRSFKQTKRIYASCEDYRAAATIDLEHDKKDRNKKLNIPIQVLWGKKGLLESNLTQLKYGKNIQLKKFMVQK